MRHPYITVPRPPMNPTICSELLRGTPAGGYPSPRLHHHLFFPAQAPSASLSWVSCSHQYTEGYE